MILISCYLLKKKKIKYLISDSIVHGLQVDLVPRVRWKGICLGPLALIWIPSVAEEEVGSSRVLVTSFAGIRHRSDDSGNVPVSFH